MVEGEALLFWATVGLYLISSCVALFCLIFRKLPWLRWAVGAMALAFLVHTLTLGLRWFETGHPPVMRDYENTLAGSWVMVLGALIVLYRFRNFSALTAPVALFVLLMLGYGVMRTPQAGPLTPPYQSVWLFIHVIFAWLAYASYSLAAGVALTYLVGQARPALVATNQLYRPFSSLEVLDDLSYRLITFGFVAEAVMLAAGSIWASRLWGSYWSWDPVETWALISWIIYAIYLHLRLFFGWQGRRSAYLAVFALLAVIFSFWGVNFLAGGLHIFNLI